MIFYDLGNFFSSIKIKNHSLKKEERDKKLEGILGCLIAFATQIAFNQRDTRFVSLTPKTRLIDYYIHHYGFSQYGRNLAIDGEASMNLIKKYLLS